MLEQRARRSGLAGRQDGGHGRTSPTGPGQSPAPPRGRGSRRSSRSCSAPDRPRPGAADRRGPGATAGRTVGGASASHLRDWVGRREQRLQVGDPVRALGRGRRHGGQQRACPMALVQRIQPQDLLAETRPLPTRARRRSWQRWDRARAAPRGRASPGRVACGRTAARSGRVHHAAVRAIGARACSASHSASRQMTIRSRCTRTVAGAPTWAIGTE